MRRSPFSNVLERNLKVEMLIYNQPFHFAPSVEFSCFEALGSLSVLEKDQMENGIFLRPFCKMVLPFISPV